MNERNRDLSRHFSGRLAAAWLPQDSNRARRIACSAPCAWRGGSGPTSVGLILLDASRLPRRWIRRTASVEHPAELPFAVVDAQAATELRAQVANVDGKQLDMTFWLTLCRGHSPLCAAYVAGLVRHLPAGTDDTRSPSSDQGYSGSRGHQAKRDGAGTREWCARTRERKGVPAWKWVDGLLKQEGRLSSWDRQFLKCLRGLGKDLALTMAQWRRARDG